MASLSINSTISPGPTVEIHPDLSTDGLLVRVMPPRQPVGSGLKHVPCDIVLVIDVSGSMESEAPVPTNPGEQTEHNGLTVLDLTKHAARTILETLDEDDRLGIVTFAGEAEVVQKLIPMTAANKKLAKRNIDKMYSKDITNLWHGIKEGIKLFETDGKGSLGKVPAIMVLTDGMPNHMCPPQGYVPMLRGMERLPATIHTFGFGYSLRSGLLKSIAEIGGGNYSFIPDAGMIGTVFIHAVANLQSTYANNAVLRLTYPEYLELEETTGQSVDKIEPSILDEEGPDATKQLTIQLSNIQYGQSRDIYLRHANINTIRKAAEAGFETELSSEPPAVSAFLDYQRLTNTVERATATQTLLIPSPTIEPSVMAYHDSRSRIIAFLSTLYPLRPDEEHQALPNLPSDMASQLQALIAALPITHPDLPFDTACQSLLHDLIGASPVPEARPTGQIALALSTPEFYNRWGVHYLPSLAGAHTRQACNSFKDPGPLQYGINSPLFRACRDLLDAAFDALPAPKPSRNTGYTGTISMSSYNRSSNPCFAGCVSVALAGEEGMVRVGRLRAGMQVLTPKGARRVVAVLRTPVKREKMCLMGEGLLVTPWHPVKIEGQGGWVFPKDVAKREVRYTGSIYSVLLQRDGDTDAHAIMVGGVWGVTLGHGLTGQETGDVRAHQFLGSYDRVIKSLASLHRSRSGLVLGGGVQRNKRTGMVDGFRKASSVQVRDVARKVTVQIKGIVHA
ncbi:hint-domain-containing protein [Lasiosphaeris hirsuta]|uniref:Hint-domain-containing protein n=1 Tax=Lasiosphaeris hirsuta TaxID=260670 RepID=A0AA40DPV7_9PEZI|nr:hint-domain-containing protein [Lasiosphaeris hirsuta]